MVGTGVFTRLGFQPLDSRSGIALMLLWALSGAMTYGELGAALPRSEGEYSQLHRIYHSAAGFLSGWISSPLGLSRPVTLAAMTYAHGLRSLLTVLDILIGSAAVIAMLALSNGASFEAQQQFRELGASDILLKSV